MKHLTNYQLYPLFNTWLSIRQRCTDPACPSFEHYGGRGIQMCERWANSVDAFVVDMGPRPEGHSIDRIDVNGHYEPSNCRWATREQQARNKRNTKLSDDDVRNILEAVRSGVPLSHIPLAYPVTWQHAQKIAAGLVRRLPDVDYAGLRPAVGSRARKLTAEDVKALRAEHAAGAKIVHLAAKYGIHRNNVRRIVSGALWKDV